MKKRIISFVLAICLLVSMVPSMGVRASAAENPYYKEHGIKYYQLFGTNYLRYLSSDQYRTVFSSQLESGMVEAYTAVVNSYGGFFDFLPAYITALKEGGAKILINELASKFGMSKSTASQWELDTVKLLMQEVCSNENAIISVTNDLADNFSNIKQAYDITTKTGQIIFMNDMKDACETLSDKEVEEIAGTLFKETDDLLESVETGIEAWQFCLGIIELQEMQEHIIVRLRDSVPAERSDLDDALNALLDEMHKNIGEHIIQKYCNDKVIDELADAIEGAIISGIISTSDLTVALGNFVLKTLANLLYHGATAEEIFQTTILSSYTQEISNAIIGIENEMMLAHSKSTPVGISLVSDFEFLYSVYITSLRVTLESALKTAKNKEQKQEVQTQLKLCNQYTYTKYVQFTMRDINAAIQAGNQVAHPEICGFPTATIKSETPASGTLTVTKESANIMDRPCSIKTDVLSVLLESGALGVEYAVTAVIENTKGNTWYKITTKSGQTGYIYSGNCTYAGASDATITGLDMPTTLSVGSRYWIKGTVSANSSTILSVSCYVYDAAGNPVTGGKADVNGKTYVLDNSAIDTATEFNILGAGTYTWKITANVDVGNACQEVVLGSGTLVIGKTTTSAGNAQAIQQQIRDTYSKSLQASGRASFDGFCGAYVGYQMYILGIINPCYAPNGCDSFDTYRYLSESSGGYRISAYPATNYSISSALNAITNNGTVNAYNIMLGFQKGYDKNPYGHCLFIHGIIDGVVYCSESFGFSSGGYHPEGSVLTYSFAQLENFYIYNGYEFEGAIHFQTKACSHNYTESVTKAATCTTDGIRTKTCTLCNDTITETIPALGHDYQEKLVEATCGSYGYTHRTCSRCDFSETLEPSEEYWSAWSTEKPENLSEKLIRPRTEYKEMTTSAETSLEGWTKAGAASWTEYGDWSDWGITPITGSATTEVETATVWGYYYLLCPNCGAHMHGYGTCWTWADGCGAPTYNTGWREIWSPISWDSANLREFRGTGKYWTDTIDGNRVFQWTDNGHATTGYRSRTKTEIQGFNYYRWTENEIEGAETRTVYSYYTGNLADHSWDNGAITKEPTENTEGEKTFTCTVCGATKKEAIPAKGGTEPSTPSCTNGHGYEERITQKPTKTSSGTLSYICIDCGHVETVELPPLTEDSKYQKEVIAPSCTEKGYTIYRWSPVVYIESDFTDATGHTWNGGVVTKEPTASSEGVKTYTCTVCSEVKTESIPRKDHIHNFVNGTCLLCGAVDPNWDYTDLITPIAYRKAGANRFDTAFLVADTMKAQLGVAKFDAVIVASGVSFADALSGSYLAAVKNAPILLSFNDKYNNMAKDYIRENLTPGGTVYILGGTSAVPASMETGLDGFKVKRLAGKDRFGTNLEILKEAGVEDKPILVCTGLSFADSLSASAAEMPILLVWNKLTKDQETFLENAGDEFYIIGGESAVSCQMEEQLRDYGYVERIGGKNRFETSVRIAEEFFDNPDAVVLAYAWNFPDGLCGGALAAAMDAPLILTMDKYESQAEKYVFGKTLPRRFVLGSGELISDDAIRTIFGPATDIR